MSKSIFLAATVLILLGATLSWSQEEATQSAPVGGQTPAQPGADPFGPPEAGAPRRGGTSAKEGSTSTAAIEKTPVFLADHQSEQSQKILTQLRKPIGDAGFNFTEAPLSEVLLFISKEYDIEIQLDTQALDDLGLSPEDLVTVNVRNVSLQNALKLMLKQHDLTYLVADEVLLITSEDEALSTLSVRVYPVGDLLQPKEGQPQGSGGSVENLIDTLIATVASDSWGENGGGEAEIRALQPGLLVISQTEAVHKEIGQVLAALRRAREHEFAQAFAPSSLSRLATAPPRGFDGWGGPPADKKSDQSK